MTQSMPSEIVRPEEMARATDMDALLKPDHSATLPLSLRNWIRARRDLTNAAKMVLESYLEDSISRKKSSVASLPRSVLSVSVLSERVGLSERSIKRANAELVGEDLISRDGMNTTILIQSEVFRSLCPTRRKPLTSTPSTSSQQNVSDSVGADRSFPIQTSNQDTERKFSDNCNTGRNFPTIGKNGEDGQKLSDKEKFKQKFSGQFGFEPGCDDFREMKLDLAFTDRKLSEQEQLFLLMAGQWEVIKSENIDDTAPKQPSERGSRQSSARTPVSSKKPKKAEILKWENKPRKLKDRENERVEKLVGKFPTISSPKEVKKEIIFSLEQGVFQKHNLNHALNIISKMVRKGQWKRPFAMPKEEGKAKGASDNLGYRG